MSEDSAKFKIIKSLENLSSRDLKKFRTKLCDRKEEPCFTTRSVEDADEMDLADLLVKTCTEKKALQLTIDIFNQLEFKDEAEKLATALASNETSSGTKSKYMIGDQHFIDKYRTALIEKITAVDPILDYLLQAKVISHENYSDVRIHTTSYKRMRELLELGSIRTSMKGKDCLYDALMVSETFLMEELKEGS